MTILGPWESKPEEDIISYESDLAKEMLGKRVGRRSTSSRARAGRSTMIEPYR